MINRIPGTHDMLNMQLYNAVLATIKEYLTRATFSEISTPLIEHTELFQRSLGLGTDVISKEMYYVASAHAPAEERTLLCLRPEATAAIMRAYLNEAVQEQPWKVFTVGPMFRHERPQKGRYRQFHQVSIETLGASSVYEDALLLLLLERLFTERFSMRDHVLLINYMGCSTDKAAYTTLIRRYAEDHEDVLCTTCQERLQTNVLRIFDCKIASCQTVLTKAPYIAQSLCATCTTEWNQLQTILQQLSVNYIYTPHLVRGLDYYEKTVFEFTSSRLGAQATFCGGGAV